MSTLTASALPVLGPSWDETIVPTLRKRLESESRIIGKRLSTVSITEDISSIQTGKRTISPSLTSNDDRAAGVGSYSQRPSAIPRPSYVRERPTGTAVQTKSGESTTRRPGMKRQRTQSTPFSLEILSKSPEPSLPDGLAALGLTSRSQGGQTIPTPSRIPTVSRNRSASQSSQHVVNGGKASLPPSQITASDTAYSSETLPRSLKVNASSSNLSKQRIMDEQRPFASESSTIDIERLSSDEETPFQHWYRGDVSRNGGVGEYRVGNRMEMLDIANYGHHLGSDRRKRAYEEPILSENIARLPRKRAESISSRERASIYIDPKDEINGRVLDEMPLTDVDGEETDYEQSRHTIDPMARLASTSHYDYPHATSELPGSNQHQPSETSTIYPLPQIPVYNSRSQVQHPQSQSSRRSPYESGELSVSHKGSSPPIASTSTNNAQARLTTEQQRGRTKASANRSKASTQPKGQKRSKSAGDALRSPATEPTELGDYDGLADAIPDTRVPVPKTGNWDDVILPTIARKMGIEYEQEDSDAAKNQREELFEPAPGTFGYDHSKYKPPRSGEHIPMAEFGQRIESAEEEPAELMPPSGHKSPRSKRETMPTSPPFSDYHAYSDNARERSEMPQIIIQQPLAEPPHTEVRVEETAGCCKCIVM